MLEFKIIEGMFCSGKSSMLTDVAQVLDLREVDVLREPTTPFCPSATHSETQRALFDTYVAAWTRESDVYEAAGGAAVLGDKTIWWRKMRSRECGWKSWQMVWSPCSTAFVGAGE